MRKTTSPARAEEEEEEIGEDVAGFHDFLGAEEGAGVRRSLSTRASLRVVRGAPVRLRIWKVQRLSRARFLRNEAPDGDGEIPGGPFEGFEDGGLEEEGAQEDAVGAGADFVVIEGAGEGVFVPGEKHPDEEVADNDAVAGGVLKAFEEEIRQREPSEHHEGDHEVHGETSPAAWRFMPYL
jgi:hypothetical protein